MAASNQNSVLPFPVLGGPAWNPNALDKGLRGGPWKCRIQQGGDDLHQKEILEPPPNAHQADHLRLDQIWQGQVRDSGHHPRAPEWHLWRAGRLEIFCLFVCFLVCLCGPHCCCFLFRWQNQSNLPMTLSGWSKAGFTTMTALIRSSCPSPMSTLFIRTSSSAAPTVSSSPHWQTGKTTKQV